MALLPVGYGKRPSGGAEQLTEKAGEGGNAVLVIGNGSVRVLKSYVLEAESHAVKAIWNSLLWIIANKHASFWGIDYDTENTVVFTNSTKHLFLKPSISEDFPELPPPLADITAQASRRALHLLAEAGHAWWLEDHRKIYYATSAELQSASTSHFCADVKPLGTEGGAPIIDGGGIERMYGTNAFVKTHAAVWSALAIKLTRWR